MGLHQRIQVGLTELDLGLFKGLGFRVQAKEASLEEVGTAQGLGEGSWWGLGLGCFISPRHADAGLGRILM